MFYKFKKIIITAGLFFLPTLVFAGPSVTWSTPPTISNGVLTGYVTVSGIDAQTQDLMLIIFSDSDPDFNPYVSSAILGPASNNTFNFQAPFDGTLTHFLPVLDGTFDGGTSFDPFSAEVVGQVAQVGGGAGGGGNAGGGTNTNPTDTTNCDGAADTTNCEDGVDSTNCEDGVDSTNCEQAISFSPATTIHNPLGVDFDILEFLQHLFENFVKIALPFLVLFTIYSGLLFVMARGNEEKITDAKKNLLYVIIGAAIVLGSWTIAKVLSGTVDQFEAFHQVIRLLV